MMFALLAPASAQQFVSIKGEGVNLRAAPNLRSEVLWELGSGYPLKVLARRGSWVQVVDFENDRGWVSRRLTSSRPHSIVKAPRANVRSGPGTKYRVLRQAQYGEVFRVVERTASWIRVRGEDARTGWIARGLLWGVGRK
ncbi:peptide-binding protein [Ramlibacter rhizophilus]|uniref:Peptide-binding protein n=2 Tax=Ramlibacter rhizophilus TaxID=1781167 RepID=A0A4Z0BF50_9BURK|nr:peptide-binding protein [Ramlibacter rhizophilus]